MLIVVPLLSVLIMVNVSSMSFVYEGKSKFADDIIQKEQELKNIEDTMIIINTESNPTKINKFKS